MKGRARRDGVSETGFLNLNLGFDAEIIAETRFLNLVNFERARRRSIEESRWASK